MAVDAAGIEERLNAVAVVEAGRGGRPADLLRIGAAVVGEVAGAFAFTPESTVAGLVAQGEAVGIQSDPDIDADILSLRELLIYGLKGLAAYADHARILGQEDDSVYAFIHSAMAATLNQNPQVDELVGLALKCGEVNIRAMQLLDAANTGTYGHPVPTPVPLGAKAGGYAHLPAGLDIDPCPLVGSHTCRLHEGHNAKAHVAAARVRRTRSRLAASRTRGGRVRRASAATVSHHVTATALLSGPSSKHTSAGGGSYECCEAVPIISGTTMK